MIIGGYKMLFLGIDVGTQGVRCAAVDASGHVYAHAEKSFAVINAAKAEGHKEQLPEDWWCALKESLAELFRSVSPSEIRAVSLDGTSGTVVALDENYRVISPALMYNDARSKIEAEELVPIAWEHEKKMGYTFNSSYALPKIKWCIIRGINAAHFVNQADYIVGRLTGEYCVTDYSNALKMGYDLIDMSWSRYISEYGVEIKSLPNVVKNGTLIARVNSEAAAETGLREGTGIYAGTTDGIASSIAAGLSDPGDWASVLGSTLVIKGITEKIIRNDSGSIYCHRHPEGWWMPGGASNAGGVYLNDVFGKEHFEAYNSKLGTIIPSGGLCYPFSGVGERFPFYAPNMKPFNNVSGDTLHHYAAAMEGVGYVERMIYEVLEKGGAEVSESINTVGGGCKSPEWLEIRASILGRELKVPQHADASVGAAMIAAAGEEFGKLSEAVRSMCVIEKKIEPNEKYVDRYSEIYGEFYEACRPFTGE